jgi:hypothetical protein
MKTLLVLLLTLSARVLSAQSPVAGSWKAEFDTQIGLQKYVYALKQDGASLSGTATADVAGEKRDVVLKDVKLEGDTLTFIETLEFQGNQVAITYTGIVAGDEIKFVRKVADFATETFVARRNKAAGA